MMESVHLLRGISQADFEITRREMRIFKTSLSFIRNNSLFDRILILYSESKGKCFYMINC